MSERGTPDREQRGSEQPGESTPPRGPRGAEQKAEGAPPGAEPTGGDTAPSIEQPDTDIAPSEPRPSQIQAAAREALSIALFVTLATGAAITYAFNPERAGKPSILIAIGSLYACLSVAALYRLHRRGELGLEMRPQSGDVTIGAITAALLYGAAMAGHLTLASRGSPREAWIIRIYLQIGIGDPIGDSHMILGALVFVIAALEEIVWRGLVMRSLEGAIGAQRAWLLSTLLFAVAHVPTCLLLADAVAGLNPLLVGAALGCSFIWGYLAIRTQRLVPAIFAHALFSWAMIEFPVWRP